MAQDVYQKLARHLDKLPGGYPPTESGVELRILKRLFTPEQASLATKLTLIPERAGVVARRAGLPMEECARRLDEMSAQGLILSFEQNGHTHYMAAQYVIGIWEYHVNSLDLELIKDMREYIPELFDLKTWQQAPQLRTIPVGKSLTAEHEVMAYEQAEEIIKRQKRILVAPCICRREHKMTGDACDRPEETCLVFGGGSVYYEKNRLGRVIDQEEALAILKKAEKTGLVLNPGNAKKPMNICCCCGCCCGVLKSIKRHPRPAEVVSTPFIAALDQDKCTACGVCVKRCQMDALAQAGEDKAALNPDRCIGCGLCVTTCPGKALKLARKARTPEIPDNTVQYFMHLGKVRGKLKPHDLAWMQLKSKVDRLLAKS